MQLEAMENTVETLWRSGVCVVLKSNTSNHQKSESNLAHLYADDQRKGELSSCI